MQSVATRWYRTLAITALVAYTALFFLQQTTLVTSDLGRHISNGQVTLGAWRNQDWQTFQRLITTNYYSYTEPNFPTLMHHWLFGVLVAGVHNLVGFAGLTILNTVIVAGSLLITLLTLIKLHRLTVVLLAGFVIVPFLASRTEVRPESFSLLFSSLMFWLGTYSETTANRPWFRTLGFGGAAGLISALWVNTHIFFFLGPLISLLFVLDTVLLRKKISRDLIAISSVSILGVFLTPLGLAGVFAPLTLFGNYGYQIVENMPLWFMIERFGSPIYWYMAVLFMTTICVATVQGKRLLQTRPSSIFLAMLAIIGTVVLNRFANIAALLLLPLLATLLPKNLWQKLNRLQNTTSGLLTLSISSVAVFLICVGSGLFIPTLRNFGVGLSPGSLATTEFLATQNIPGPIFNNYDIGSYLLYKNNEPGRVFVDNRPEAYSSEFLRQTLIAAQEDEAVWEKIQEQYTFSSIVFYRHDQTPWAQPFLIRRIQDAGWVPVFVDEYSLILVRNSPEHTELIQKFKLPAELFSATAQ